MNVRTGKKMMKGLFCKKINKIIIITYKMDYELGENNIEMRKIQGDKN